MSTPKYWDEAKGQLARNDRRLAKIISEYRGESLKNRGDAFYTLARSIVGQQISVKVADTIWSRFEAETKANPQNVIAAKEDALKNCGLSSQKIAYLKSIAEFMQKHDGNWRGEDEEIIRLLCEIKGVGRWTAEMFMIFHLQRPDILPLADLGLQKAIEKAYGEDADPKIISEKWRPFRSVATWYLWRSLDPVPVEY